jgi:galactokinase
VPASVSDQIEALLPVLHAESWLRAGAPTTLAAAPGRLDVMGGIADYSGATVLEATIGDLAVVALQRREDDRLRVRTTGPQVGHLHPHELSLHLTAFYEGGRLKRYDAVRALFPAETRWAAYVLGVFYVLLAEGVLQCFQSGADLLVRSDVPLGAGVASSAALEVASMRAVCAAYGVSVEPMRLAALCQVVENGVVGAPCGIMDQVTCALGRAAQLLALRCQPHDVLGYYSPPPGNAFIGLDSGVKHAVGGVRYPRVRCAAFMGKRIIEHASGQPVPYLADISPLRFRRDLRQLLPARLTGAEFVERWGHTDDPATTILPDEVYSVRGATEHPIYEHARVEHFARQLERGQAGAAGRLMYGSHRSYSRNCGLGSTETDLLASLVRRRGAGRGLYGAKITGGGSGGTVAVLIETQPNGRFTQRVAEALDEIGCEYESAVGRAPRLISGSSPGAAEIEPLAVRW